MESNSPAGGGPEVHRKGARARIAGVLRLGLMPAVKTAVVLLVVLGIAASLGWNPPGPLQPSAWFALVPLLLPILISDWRRAWIESFAVSLVIALIVLYKAGNARTQQHPIVGERVVMLKASELSSGPLRARPGEKVSLKLLQQVDEDKSIITHDYYNLTYRRNQGENLVLAVPTAHFDSLIRTLPNKSGAYLVPQGTETVIATATPAPTATATPVVTGATFALPARNVRPPFADLEGNTAVLAVLVVRGRDEHGTVVQTTSMRQPVTLLSHVSAGRAPGTDPYVRLPPDTTDEATEEFARALTGASAIYLLQSDTR